MAYVFGQNKRIQLTGVLEGHWAEVMAALTVEASIALDKLAKANKVHAGDQDDGDRYDKIDQAIRLAVIVIRAWSIADADGNIVPITEAAIRALPIEFLTDISDGVGQSDFLKKTPSKTLGASSLTKRRRK